MELFQGFREGAVTSMGNQCYLDKDWTGQRYNHFRASERVPAMRWGISVIWTRIVNSAPLRTGSSVQVQPVRSPAQRWRIGVLFERGLDHERTDSIRCQGEGPAGDHGGSVLSE